MRRSAPPAATPLFPVSPFLPPSLLPSLHPSPFPPSFALPPPPSLPLPAVVLSLTHRFLLLHPCGHTTQFALRKFPRRAGVCGLPVGSLPVGVGECVWQVAGGRQVNALVSGGRQVNALVSSKTSPLAAFSQTARHCAWVRLEQAACLRSASRCRRGRSLYTTRSLPFLPWMPLISTTPTGGRCETRSSDRCP